MDAELTEWKSDKENGVVLRNQRETVLRRYRGSTQMGTELLNIKVIKVSALICEISERRYRTDVADVLRRAPN